MAYAVFFRAPDSCIFRSLFKIRATSASYSRGLFVKPTGQLQILRSTAAESHLPVAGPGRKQFRESGLTQTHHFQELGISTLVSDDVHDDVQHRKAGMVGQAIACAMIKTQRCRANQEVPSLRGVYRDLTTLIRLRKKNPILEANPFLFSVSEFQINILSGW
jgi:hypothetical protein